MTLSNMNTRTDRQSSAARCLSTPPSSRYEMFRFEVEDTGRSLFVTREYGLGEHIRYFECWSVGPRGGAKLRGKRGPC